jgi:hypothetical protein
MHFRLSLTLPGLSLHPDGVQPIELMLHHDHDLRVVIDGPPDGNATCDVYADAEPPKKVAEAFRSLAAGTMPAKSLPREEWARDHDYISEDGRIQGNHVLPMYLMPPSAAGVRREPVDADKPGGGGRHQRAALAQPNAWAAAPVRLARACRGRSTGQDWRSMPPRWDCCR